MNRVWILDFLILFVVCDTEIVPEIQYPSNIPLNDNMWSATATYYQEHKRRKEMRQNNLGVRYEVFTAVKIQVEVFWIVISCNVVVGYQCVRDVCCSETFVSYHNTTTQPRRPQLELRCHQVLLKSWDLSSYPE
jgi:hypothetical protein